MTIIRIEGEIGFWGVNSRDVRNQLNEATGDIEVHIMSPGGSVVEGIAIFNALKSYDKGKVIVVVGAYAASMATYIAMSGDVIKAYDNSIFMIHNPWNVAVGDYKDMQKNSLVLQGMSNILKKAYISKTEKSEKDMTKAMDEETYYFGNELLTNGFVDEIVSTENEKDSISAKAILDENFNACMKNVKANEKKEDFEQIAAIANIDTTLRVNSASAQIENKQQGETSMEYTKESFEALEKQHAEALKTSKTDASEAERKRVSEIMALGGNQEFTSKAIQEGTSAGEAAIALLTTDKDNLVAAKTNQETAKAKANFEAAAEEVSEVATSEATIEDAEAKAWKEAEDKVYGGKK